MFPYLEYTQDDSHTNGYFQQSKLESKTPDDNQEKTHECLCGQSRTNFTYVAGHHNDRDGMFEWSSGYSNLFAKRLGRIIYVHLVLVHMHERSRLARVLGRQDWDDDRGAYYYSQLLMCDYPDSKEITGLPYFSMASSHRHCGLMEAKFNNSAKNQQRDGYGVFIMACTRINGLKGTYGTKGSKQAGRRSGDGLRRTTLGIGGWWRSPSGRYGGTSLPSAERNEALPWTDYCPDSGRSPAQKNNEVFYDISYTTMVHKTVCSPSIFLFDAKQLPLVLRQDYGRDWPTHG
ncbi:hypothetical protein M434DRAFT_26953 [Hypoxylon sp. CO27-5]|nr:hypothetical protein M434DRAFT_26953 [Hypoxylon sp. CO27-5]